MQYLTEFLVAMGILALFVVIGNILVLMTFARDSSLRNSTGLLIISLSMTDLLTGLIALPCVIMAMVPNLELMTKGFGCNFSGVLVFSLFNCSLLNLSLISLQRFFLITKPHNVIFSKERVMLMIVLVWAYSFGASCVPLHPRFNGFVVYDWSLSCILDLSENDGYLNKYYSAVYNTITFLISFVTLSFTQYRILRIIYSRTRTKDGSSTKSRQLSENRRHYATKMISCMIAGFLICTIPIMILLFLKVFEYIPRKEFAAFAGFMTWFNSLLNPIIYWYFNRHYRTSFSTSLRISKRRFQINASLLRERSTVMIKSGRMSLSQAPWSDDKSKKYSDTPSSPCELIQSPVFQEMSSTKTSLKVTISNSSTSPIVKE